MYFPYPKDHLNYERVLKNPKFSSHSGLYLIFSLALAVQPCTSFLTSLCIFLVLLVIRGGLNPG